VGLDLFDHPETLEGILPKLVRSYALDAVELAGRVSAPPSREEAEGFLGELASAVGTRYESPGLGEDLRIRAPGLTASALLFEDRVVHLSAFRTEEARGGNGGNGEGRGLRRPSLRRRSRNGGSNGRC
jgi:hypothetical protein